MMSPISRSRPSEGRWDEEDTHPIETKFTAPGLKGPTQLTLDMHANVPVHRRLLQIRRGSMRHRPKGYMSFGLEFKEERFDVVKGILCQTPSSRKTGLDFSTSKDSPPLLPRSYRGLGWKRSGCPSSIAGAWRFRVDNADVGRVSSLRSETEIKHVPNGQTTSEPNGGPENPLRTLKSDEERIVSRKEGCRVVSRGRRRLVLWGWS